ncbi:SCF ubiquitin ligase complex subunit [Entomortierella beljakovae]|nr:SCF ubiquitin ligase complex subunit [Entomortierella beljakovae]
MQSILGSMKARALQPLTMAMITHFDTSQVEETLYNTLPEDWLLILLSNTPNLHTLCLSGKKTFSPFVQTQTFRKLANARFIHSGLRELDLSHCTDVREPALKTITAFFPNLTSINLTKTSGVTDSALSLIVDKCQYLETINISYCRLITDLGLFSLAKFCRRNLRELNLTGNLKMTNESLLTIAKYCPHIERIYLGECSQITDSAVEWIARSCSSTSLRELELHRCDKVALGLPIISILSTKFLFLERITLTYKQINSHRDDLKLVMEAFRNFERLRVIEVYEVPEHSPALFFWDLAFQASQGKLETINLYRGSFTTDFLLGNYAVAYEYDQNISDQSVRFFNERKSGVNKAQVNLFLDDFTS